MSNYDDVLSVLSSSSNSNLAKELLEILNAELSLPNIPLKTMGGEVCWDTLAEYNGWKLQQNRIFKNARILDSNNVRIAWGTINGMIKVMDRMVQCMDRYNKPQTTSEQRMEYMQEIKQLKELLDMGAITQSEYEEKKNKLMGGDLVDLLLRQSFYEKIFVM